MLKRKDLESLHWQVGDDGETFWVEDGGVLGESVTWTKEAAELQCASPELALACLEARKLALACVAIGSRNPDAGGQIVAEGFRDLLAVIDAALAAAGVEVE
jgi:hypothetical protein